MAKKKLCKARLVTKLEALFKGLEIEVIDDVVAEAKKRVSAVKERLFDSQIETLKSRGCPKIILELLQNQRDAVLSKAAEMDSEGIPFVPVIPRTYLSIYGLMHMVRNKNKAGYTDLNPTKIINEVETPKCPYFIYDVEDGKHMLGKSPKEAEVFIVKQKRSCLTVEETIALCIHTKILSEHYIDCTGSRYEDPSYVPHIFLANGKPKLTWSMVDNSDDVWGSASCRSRA